MEKEKRVAAGRLPAVPLITCDPYFSVWSGSDRLYETDSMHWTGKRKRITGTVKIDGIEYRFMGRGKALPMEQTKLEVTALFTKYCFEMAGVELKITFWTPLLLNDLDVLSRPCSYLDMEVCPLDGKKHQVEVLWEFSGELCCNQRQTEKIGGGSYGLEAAQTAWLGLREQRSLGHSGDSIAIDWGYLYLAAEEKEDREISYCQERRCLCASFRFFPDKDTCKSASLVAAYDDIVSVCYFGRMLPGYWARDGKNILAAIMEAIWEHDALQERCKDFEKELEKETKIFGEAYTKICHAAYRQSIAAHKLIADEKGKAVFISKECHSNGCAATVDITYPSAPLFLIYNPELVRAMLRPVTRFAKMPVWGYDFAPHDAGRYPYVTGQVYGLQAYQCAAQDLDGGEEDGYVYPMFYQMPESAQIYRMESQMPVEESGNLLILAAQLARTDPQGEKEIIKENLPLYEKWVKYLLQYGSDPGEQLCTDDFAGHMAHNVNLAMKAIMGVEAYSILLRALGRDDEAVDYHERAAQVAKDVYGRVRALGHTKLTFDGDDKGWSMKYNAVWDLIFGSGFWNSEFYAGESEYYREKCNAYGVPLDSRENYTKSDWMMWAASFDAEGRNVGKFAQCILNFLENSSDRVPFSDWYQTDSGRQQGFQNRTVQGGIFMPLLVRKTVTES